jgi:hypothetical protein
MILTKIFVASITENLLFHKLSRYFVILKSEVFVIPSKSFYGELQKLEITYSLLLHYHLLTYVVIFPQLSPKIQNSSFNAMTRLPGWPGLDYRWDTTSLFATCPDRLWGPPSLLYSTYLGSFIGDSRLCGLVVSVFAIAPKVRGFKPCRGRWILREIKIRCWFTLSNVVVESLTLLLRILEVPFSILGPSDRLSWLRFFHGLPQTFQTNVGVVL